MADLSTITLPNNVTYNLKDSRVPANAVFTDTKVTQTASTSNANHEVLFSATADNTTRTEGSIKSNKFTANPSTGEFYAEGYKRIDITGQTININDYNLSSGTPNAKFYIERTDGGANNITNIPVAGKPFLLDVELIRWSTTADYITRQTFRNAANPANEYVRFCTSGTWGNWVTRVFTDNNTDTKVTQTATTTSANYEVLFSATADNTTRTEAARKNNNLLFNPSTGNLQATQYSVNAKATIAYDTTENAITFNFV